MFNESTMQHSHFLLISRIVNYSRKKNIYLANERASNIVLDNEEI